MPSDSAGAALAPTKLQTFGKRLLSTVVLDADLRSFGGIVLFLIPTIVLPQVVVPADCWDRGRAGKRTGCLATRPIACPPAYGTR